MIFHYPTKINDFTVGKIGRVEMTPVYNGHHRKCSHHWAI